MGCDIHMYPEVKRNGKWEFVYRFQPGRYYEEEPEWKDRANYYAWEDRWYWLFGQLAGVRRPGPPIVEPRGFPSDASQAVVAARDDGDGDYHSWSWLTLAELKAHPFRERHDGTVTEESIAPVFEWISRLSELDENPENVRVVFAFDN